MMTAVRVAGVSGARLAVTPAETTLSPSAMMTRIPNLSARCAGSKCMPCRRRPSAAGLTISTATAVAHTTARPLTGSTAPATYATPLATPTVYGLITTGKLALRRIDSPRTARITRYEKANTRALPRPANAPGAAAAATSVTAAISRMSSRWPVVSATALTSSAMPTQAHQSGVRISIALPRPTQPSCRVSSAAACVTAKTRTRS